MISISKLLTPVTGPPAGPAANTARTASVSEKSTGGKDSAFLKELKAPLTKNDTGRTLKNDAFMQLEAAFLRNFAEMILPKEENGMLRTGITGDYWRSMQADQIANAMASSGHIGIAEILRSRFEKIHT